ncbi:MAG: TIGR01777 family protein [Planctomycetes bacterium]|nr:TIGR01777 family protein [Planctomycetota bacterium]
MRTFIAGGTGLVGSRLVVRLLERNDQVTVLTRRPEVARQKWGQSCAVVTGDPMQPGPWMDGLADCDGVVNLVGEGVFNRRWSASFKELLRTSRVLSTRNIVVALSKNPHNAAGQPKILVNASAIGYYGPTGDEELTEDSPAGSDMLARLCVEWEQEAQAGATSGLRVVLLRVGVVLDREGGALKKMILPFKLFMGGKTGSGKQWVSWIHHEDLVGMIVLALDEARARGPMNGTAPNPLPNRDFARALGRALHRPSIMPAPAFALRVVLGQVAGVITKGQRVLPRKALEWGYVFKFPDIDVALNDALS